MNRKHLVVILQIIIVSLCFPIFYHFGKILNPLLSFVISFLTYWFLLFLGSFLIIIFDHGTAKELKNYLRPLKNKLLVLFDFIPVVGVLIVVFIPNITNLNIRLISIVLVIALFNGILEEFFWRGIVLSKYSSSNILLVTSTLLFTLYHFAFLFLPLKFHGGAINLVGGAAMMGFLWLFISKCTRNISYAIFAHVLVNLFAFIGLFIDNKLM